MVFVPLASASAFARNEAWWVLLRWYGRTEYGSKGPLALDAQVLARYFDGGVPEFVARLLVVVRDEGSSEHLALQEYVGTLLRYSPEAGLPTITAHRAAFSQLTEGLLLVLGDPSRRLSLRCDIVRFFENNVRADRTMLDHVVTLLTPFAAGDLEFEVSTTIDRLRGG